MHCDQKPIPITAPLAEADVAALRVGDPVLLQGVIYTGRDAAHRRFVDALDAGRPLPVDLNGQVIYYVGPSPAPPGRVIGAAGPTTSYRMDPFTPQLLARGLKGMIGKGARSRTVCDAIKAHGAVYFAAVGGAGALLSSCVTAVTVAAYPDLGTEAVHRLIVKDFPVIVACDTRGGDLYRPLKEKPCRKPCS